MKAHDAVAGLPFVDAAAHGEDGTAELVAQDLRWLDVAVENFLDVRAADATGRNFDKHFAVRDLGDRNFFNADDAFFAEDAGAHGFGDGTEDPRSIESCTRAAHPVAIPP